jgi:hypothetical protein
MPLILIEPLLPVGHQGLGRGAMVVEQVQHPARTAAARAALGITADGAFLIQKAEGLLQHGFRQAQLGMAVAEVVHQGSGIAVAREQTLKNPAHSQLQAEVLHRGLLKESPNGPQAGGP